VVSDTNNYTREARGMRTHTNQWSEVFVASMANHYTREASGMRSHTNQ